MADALNPLLKPTTVEIPDQDGNTRIYTISKFPAIEGREIMVKYPLTAIPKLSEYGQAQDTMYKLMAYVAVDNKGAELRLTTKALVNNHVPDWESLMRLECEMIKYNSSFFLRDMILNFLKDLSQKVPPLATRILTDSLAQLSPMAKPPSTNSEPSTP